MKKTKEQAVREVGQLSFHHFKRLTSGTDNSSKNDTEAKSPNKKTKNNPRISLSDFLNRKLESTASTHTKSVQSKLKPFSSLVGLRDTTEVVNKHAGVKRGAVVAIEQDQLDGTILETFKCPRKRNADSVGSSSDGGGTVDDQHLLRNRSNPFHVSTLDERNIAPRHVLVLGDDAKCKHKRRKVNFSKGNNGKPLFNHYASGSGWWDCNMEGIDNEVGCNEAWEGVGSTTLGGLQWH